MGSSDLLRLENSDSCLCKTSLRIPRIHDDCEILVHPTNRQTASITIENDRSSKGWMCNGIAKEMKLMLGRVFDEVVSQSW